MNRTMPFFCLFLLTWTSIGHGLEYRSDLVSALDNTVIPINENSPMLLTNEDLECFDILSSTRLVGVGEATHGTREFFQMKYRLFKYLVEHHGFKNLAIEMDYSACTHLENYILTGEGNLDKLMTEYMQIWVHRTESLKKLIQWMQIKNLELPSGEKLHIIGIDSQLQTFNYKALANYLSIDKEIAQKFRKDLEWMKKISSEDPKSLSTSEKNDRISRLQKIAARLLKYRKTLTRKSSNRDFLSALQIVNTTRQSIEFLHAYFKDQKLLRDRYMFENVRWITQCSSSGVMIWAHNAHVFKDPDYAPDAGGSMGFLLDKEFKEKYQVIGMGFSTGEFRARIKTKTGISEHPEICNLSSSPPEHSLNYLLTKSRFNRFFLFTHQIQENLILKAFFDQVKPMLGIGDLFFPDNITEYHYDLDRKVIFNQYMDCLIYFNLTHASVMI